ncbi:MAG: phosphodiesterase [Gammaproteobacteria bacterium]|jgi:predicted AlkP superfamily pyrophosphatase or phosphodiesterase|nr:phosphodiesterase [Gammaproteobacteria bacterium]
MILPDYHGGSIVNLMQSIVRGLAKGERGDQYAPLTLAPPEMFSDSRKVVLLVIDGLGHELLLGAADDGAMRGHLSGSMTSVFPSTTASAITTFLTGCAPQQHALTGWFMWFREIGLVAAPLPFTTRVGGLPLASAGVDARRLFATQPVADALDTRCFIVQRRDLVDTSYTNALRGKAEVRGYRSLQGFFDVVRDIVNSNDSCFVYAYWPQLDSMCHRFGADDERSREHLRQIDGRFAGFLDSARGSGATVVLTADHGFIDTTPDTRLDLASHPRLADTLVLPLCGEGRAVYCYVDPAKRAQFEAYVAEELGEYCVAMDKQVMLENESFGLGEPHPRLAERIGHYVLLMKDNFVLRDSLLGEGERPVHVGVHGGVSAAEMVVPLILAQL